MTKHPLNTDAQKSRLQHLKLCKFILELAVTLTTLYLSEQNGVHSTWQLMKHFAMSTDSAARIRCSVIVAIMPSAHWRTSKLAVDHQTKALAM
jgi:hypothetical protein